MIPQMRPTLSVWVNSVAMLAYLSFQRLPVNCTMPASSTGIKMSIAAAAIITPSDPSSIPTDMQTVVTTETNTEALRIFQKSVRQSSQARARISRLLIKIPPS